MDRLRWGLLFFCCLRILGLNAQINPYDYLKLNFYQEDSSPMVLKETYTIDRSKDSDYRKRFLSAREEYDEVGRSSLTLCFDPEGDMTSKVIAYYPNEHSEKNIFQQRGSLLDSVHYQFNNAGLCTMEFWYWGASESVDTVLYTYNGRRQLTSVTVRYGWDTKRDTLLYKNGLLSKALTYNSSTGLQKEVDFYYGRDSTLIKAFILNSERLVIEEEFFFYDGKGEVYKSITKYYPEGEESDEPPLMITHYNYYPNGRFKRVKQVHFDKKGHKVSTTKLFYDHQGHLTKRQEINKEEEIFKTTIIDYTIRKKR